MKLVRNTLTLAGVSAALLIAAPANASQKCDDALSAATNVYVEEVLEITQYCEQIKLRGGRCTTKKARETRAAALAVVLQRECTSADLGDFRPGTCGGNSGGDLTTFINCVVKSANTWIDYMVAALFGLPVPPVPSPAPSGPVQPPTPTPAQTPGPGQTPPPGQTPRPGQTKSCQPLIGGPCLNAQFQGCCNAQQVKCLFNAMGEGVCSLPIGPTPVPPPPTPGPTPAPVCGDGVISGSEVCDGTALGGQSCLTQGFDGGTLACNSTCNGFNTTACTKCGNGMKEGAEACDLSDFGGATCGSVISGATGDLACNSNCTLNTTGCSVVTCNNPPGTIDPGEQCDGSNLAGQTCQSQGFPNGGPLACVPGSCQFDTSGCNQCGDGALDPGEQCDTNLVPTTCADQLGQGATGTVTCSPTACTFVTTGCQLCGNNKKEGTEVCDGSDLNNKTCADFPPFTMHGVTCQPNCGSFDTSACSASKAFLMRTDSLLE